MATLEQRNDVLTTIDSLQDEIVQTVSELVQIRSVNPGYPGADYEVEIGGETKANQYLASKYSALGLEPDVWEVAEKRANLAGKRAGGRHPVGDKEQRAFQLSFNGFLKVDFQGSRVTSDGGLLLVRELDERLGLGKLIDEHLTDSRQGSNKKFPLADLVRQSVYSRLAGYEDLNDAVRVSADRRTVDQGRQAGHELDAAVVPSLSSERGAAATERAGLHPGQLVAAARTAEQDQELVADDLATQVDEDGRSARQARPLLLAAAGGGASEPAAVR